MRRVCAGDGNLLHGRFRFLKTDFRSLAPFIGRHLIACERERVVFQNQPPLGAGNFKPVTPRRLAAGRDERARRAIGKLHVARHVILHLDVVPFANAHVAAHLARHTGDPLHRVKLMEALIEQHAAALALPRGAPAATLEIGLAAEPIGHHPDHPHQIAQLTALHQLADLLVARLHAQLEHAAELQFRPGCRRGNQALGIRFVRRDRFFHHDVQTRLQRRNAEARVLVMRRGNQKRINRPTGDHLLATAEHLHPFFLIFLQLVR